MLFDRVESARQVHDDRSGRQYPASMNSMSSHEHVIRRNPTDALDRENGVSYKGRPRPRTHHYAVERPLESESSKPRPRSFYEDLPIARDFRDQRNPVDQREVSKTVYDSHCHIGVNHIRTCHRVSSLRRCEIFANNARNTRGNFAKNYARGAQPTRSCRSTRDILDSIVKVPDQRWKWPRRSVDIVTATPSRRDWV